MSKKQPFCDSTHAGTSFKPLKFSLDEKTKSMHLCGCKLSSNAPFCDAETCKKLLAGERITVPKMEMMSETEGEEEDDDAAESQTKH